MLSKKLKIEDIINGKVYQVVPPEVEYCLIEFKLLVISILKSFSD
jgi:DNA-binding HxlR family transcriptional regulator